MNLSNIKMVVTDMDGTLLNSAHEVSPKFFELYKELKRNNILFVAASGRQFDSIAQKLHLIHDEIIIIAENGGFAVDQGKEIVSTPLAKTSKEDILQVVNQIKGAHAVLCGKHNAYIKGSTPRFIETLKEYYSEFNITEDLKGLEEEIIKIAVYHYEGSEKNIYPEVKHLQPEFKVKVSGENWVDISHPDAHKGYALDRLQRQYGISPQETLVFGDYNNDLEMLALSEFSFAMANSHPNVLKAAKYKTLSNDQLGVEVILEQLIASID